MSARAFPPFGLHPQRGATFIVPGDEMPPIDPASPCARCGAPAVQFAALKCSNETRHQGQPMNWYYVCGDCLAPIRQQLAVGRSCHCGSSVTLHARSLRGQVTR